jgi:mannose-6-phosphate isomerase
LLLKWLEARDLLSVQLHPDNLNSFLKENECGKPEAWLVLNVEKEGFVYLGFKEELSKTEIIKCLQNDEPEKCLHKYQPKKFDYISVPPGCVHAVGPGVLVAEPQYVLPKKVAKTWRISDWKRLYDEQGKLSINGKPRELHGKESFSSINWDLPHGQQLEKLLIQNIENDHSFLGDIYNPFALKLYHSPGVYLYSHLFPHTFSVFTAWGGNVTLSTAQETLHLTGGESGFICASTGDVRVKLEDDDERKASVAFFSLRS